VIKYMTFVWAWVEKQIHEIREQELRSHEHLVSELGGCSKHVREMHEQLVQRAAWEESLKKGIPYRTAYVPEPKRLG